MSTMDRAIQVTTLLAFSLGVLACAPQKNANILPANTIEKTQLTEVSVPTATVAFASSNPLLAKQTETVLIARNTPPSVKITQATQATQVTQAKPVAEQQQAAQLKPKIAYTFYGTPDQPGYQIQTAIFSLFDQGIPLDEAAQHVIDLVINQNQVIRDALSMAAVARQPNLSIALVLDIAQLTALIDATKQTMEDNPGQLSSIISLGVTLYPDFTRDIITAASLTGEMTEEDAILLAIAAGADPTLLASRTAAGTDGPGLSAFAATPLGSGVGAGGTGGGDTTASTN